MSNMNNNECELCLMYFVPNFVDAENDNTCNVEIDYDYELEQKDKLLNDTKKTLTKQIEELTKQIEELTKQLDNKNMIIKELMRQRDEALTRQSPTQTQPHWKQMIESRKRLLQSFNV